MQISGNISLTSQNSLKLSLIRLMHMSCFSLSLISLYKYITTMTRVSCRLLDSFWKKNNKRKSTELDIPKLHILIYWQEMTMLPPSVFLAMNLLLFHDLEWTSGKNIVSLSFLNVLSTSGFSDLVTVDSVTKFILPENLYQNSISTRLLSILHTIPQDILLC